MELKLILEAILFSAQKPLTPRELRDLLAAAVEHGDEAKPFKKTKEKDQMGRFLMSADTCRLPLCRPWRCCSTQKKVQSKNKEGAW